MPRRLFFDHGVEQAETINFRFEWFSNMTLKLLEFRIHHDDRHGDALFAKFVAFVGNGNSQDNRSDVLAASLPVRRILHRKQTP